MRHHSIIKYWCRCFALLIGLLLIHAGAHAQTTYYHNDPAGTPVAASDQAGNLLWRETYRPYGDRISKPTTAASNAIWFHGKPSDSASPLLNFGARNYDPILGRFVSIDPVDFDEANLHSFNRYAYGNNNPLKYKDPDGRLPDPISLAFAAHDTGPFVGAFLAWGHGVITNNPHLVSAGLEGMSETKSGLAFAALAVVTLPGSSLAARGGAASARHAADLSKHLGYAEKYGKGGVKELENGRIRYYGEVQPANKVAGRWSDVVTCMSTTLRREDREGGTRLSIKPAMFVRCGQS